MTNTTLHKVNGEISVVKGTIEQIKKEFTAKGAEMVESRIYENSLTVYIKGINVGTLIHPDDLPVWENDLENGRFDYQSK